MDFVYICKPGNNEELRYSIRSVLHSFPDANIWVVGGKPKWYVGNYININQDNHKYSNAINNLNAICRSEKISNSFILMNDDFFIIKKINTIETFYNGFISEKIDRYAKTAGRSMYVNKLMTTNKKLIQNGIKKPIDYELHIPMLMEKDKLKDIIFKYPTCLWRSMYGNMYNIGGTQMEDVKIYSDKKYKEISDTIYSESTFLSTEDKAFNLAFDSILSKMFPIPSKHESL